MDFVACTGDFWTSISNQSYMGITAHYITESFDSRQVLLSFKLFSEDKTGANIRTAFHSVLNEYNIVDKVVGFVTDSAANLIKAFEKTGIPHVKCFAHIIQLAVTKALHDEQTSPLLKRARAIVGHFKHSSKMENRLTAKQAELNIPQHKLQQEVVTRWNSTYSMIKSLTEAKGAVQETVTKKELVLKNKEWHHLSSIQKVLVYPALVTERVSGSKYVTSSLVWPLLVQLCKNLDQEFDDGLASRVSNIIGAALRESMNNFAHVDNQLMATVLDPHFKDLSFLPEAMRIKVHLFVTTELKELDGSEPLPKRAKTDDQEYALFGMQAPAPKRKYLSEWEKYLATPQAPLEIGCLDWWKVNRLYYPMLSKLARRYLCIPATSVPSEQLFSHAGDTVTKKRNKLDSETLEVLMHVGENYSKFNSL